MNGVLVVDKPAGFTSFDVVAKLRGILKERKIGHGGTLDPEATGVLPIFLGNATKLCDYFPYDEKTYFVELTLGIETDTEDIFGEVLKENPVNVSNEQVEEAILSFVGDYPQVPPMYSAKWLDGKRLYELAREGVVVERDPVMVKVNAITDLSISLPKATFRVSCSKGTYIRTLCKDIGQKLGCGGCMSVLRREQHGIFTLKEAKTIEEIRDTFLQGEMNRIFVPTEDLFPALRKVFVKESANPHFLNGNRLYREEFLEESVPEKPNDRELFRFFTEDQVFKAIYQYKEEEDAFFPHKMFL